MGNNKIKMWGWFINLIHRESLENWSWWFGVLAIVITLAGGVCGWIAFEMNDAVTKNKEAEMRKRIEKAESAAHIQPLPVRICEVLDRIDAKIIPSLKAGNRNFNGGITASQFNDLQKIANEPGARDLIVVDPDVRMGVGMGPEGITYGVKFSVNPKVLEK